MAVGCFIGRSQWVEGCPMVGGLCSRAQMDDGSEAASLWQTATGEAKRKKESEMHPRQTQDIRHALPLQISACPGASMGLSRLRDGSDDAKSR